MKNTDDIDFFYFLKRHGWSDCLIYVDGRIYQMEPTHIFNNPIEALLIAMTELLQGANECEFTWYDEPGEYMWSFKRDMDQRHKIRVSINGCTLLNATDKALDETVCFEVKIKSFSICVLRQMEKVRDLMSEASFKTNRENEFPHSIFKEYSLAHQQLYS